MSEHLAHHEAPKAETLDHHSPESHKHREHLEKAAAAAEVNKPDIDTLREQTAEHAASANETVIGEQAPVTDQPQYGQYKQLKRQAAQQGLSRIRSQLNVPDKALSKVIHQPTVDAISEGLGKTVARPWAIIGAGSTALVGSTILLLMARHYGFTYNHSVFLVLLAGGFIAGLLLEAVMRLTARLRR